ncbi:hypothetical protein TNCV_2782371 [Trichonephila clavipes]|nr:hypothetical protein TNCV_2782371 [Trichonephila clavipes]
MAVKTKQSGDYCSLVVMVKNWWLSFSSCEFESRCHCEPIMCVEEEIHINSFMAQSLQVGMWEVSRVGCQFKGHPLLN